MKKRVVFNSRYQSEGNIQAQLVHLLCKTGISIRINASFIVPEKTHYVKGHLKESKNRIYPDITLVNENEQPIHLIETKGLATTQIVRMGNYQRDRYQKLTGIPCDLVHSQTNLSVYVKKLKKKINS